jgi:hypothetical protein
MKIVVNTNEKQTKLPVFCLCYLLKPIHVEYHVWSRRSRSRIGYGSGSATLLVPVALKNAEDHATVVFRLSYIDLVDTQQETK